MKSTNSNKLLKIFIYYFVYNISTYGNTYSLDFCRRWPWPQLMLPATYSLRAIKEIFAPYSNVFSILFSSILLSLSVAILSAIIASNHCSSIGIIRIGKKQ